MEPLVSVLIWLLVFAVIAGIVYWIITLIPLPEPFKRIVMVVFLLIVCLIALLRLLPMLGMQLP
jgi:hypothetical protein